jgi:hypothetical protein
MDKVIKVILLTNNQKLISEIVEIGADIGEPDCKLIEPFEISKGHSLLSWMIDETNQTEFMISSDKIITLADPNSELLEKYNQLTK